MLYFLQGWLLLMFDVWTWNIQNCNCMDQKQLFSGFLAISFLNTFCYKFIFLKILQNVSKDAKQFFKHLNFKVF